MVDIPGASDMGPLDAAPSPLDASQTSATSPEGTFNFLEEAATASDTSSQDIMGRTDKRAKSPQYHELTLPPLPAKPDTSGHYPCPEAPHGKPCEKKCKTRSEMRYVKLLPFYPHAQSILY